MHNQPSRSLLISATATPSELQLLLLTVFQCSSTVDADLQNLMKELAQGGHFFVKNHESESITAKNRATFVGLYFSNLEGFADTQHFQYSLNHQPLPPVSNHSTYQVLIALQYLDGAIQWVPLLETNHVHPLGFDELLVELPSGLYRSVSLSEGGGLVVPIIPLHWTQSEQPYSIIPATTLMAAAQTVLAEFLPPTSFVQVVSTEVQVCFHVRYSPGTGVHGDTGVSCKFLLPASDTVGTNPIAWHFAWDLKAQEPFEASKTFRMALQHLHGHFAQIAAFRQVLTQFKNVPSDQLQILWQQNTTWCTVILPDIQIKWTWVYRDSIKVFPTHYNATYLESTCEHTCDGTETPLQAKHRIELQTRQLLTFLQQHRNLQLMC